MTDDTDDVLGPIDYLVVEFPAGSSSFSGDMARELESLVEAGIIRILDVLILQKDDDGQFEALELEDLGDRAGLAAFEAQMAEILAAEDVAHLAEAMDPGSVAGVLIWENRWAAPFAVAARKAGGQLIANGRIPTQAIIASLEADQGNQGD